MFVLELERAGIIVLISMPVEESSASEEMEEGEGKMGGYMHSLLLAGLPGEREQSGNSGCEGREKFETADSEEGEAQEGL